MRRRCEPRSEQNLIVVVYTFASHSFTTKWYYSQTLLMITIPQQWGAQKVNASKTLNLVFIPMGPTFTDLLSFYLTSRKLSDCTQRKSCILFIKRIKYESLGIKLISRHIVLIGKKIIHVVKSSCTARYLLWIEFESLEFSHGLHVVKRFTSVS